jgi:hypothetical protein
MKIFYNSLLFKLPFIKNFEGMVIGKLCFLKQPKNNSIEQKSLLIHEAVHIEQMNRVGIIKYYFIYFRDFFTNYLKYKDMDKAYFLIPYEIEAYKIQNDYLRKYRK